MVNFKEEMTISKPLIAICLVTYNQENYIEQAINSVLSQHTTYPFVIYIGDDYSTDNTGEICKEFYLKYPDRIKLLQNITNIGLVKNSIKLFNEIKKDGIKYIAMLDGDDYWIDNLKLEKQCSFLELNDDFGLVFSNTVAFNGKKLIKNKPLTNIYGKISLQYAKIFPLPNNTVFFRTELLNLIDFNDFIKFSFMSCDYAMYVVFSNYTKFKSFDAYMAVCRRGHNSVSHPKEFWNWIKYIENDIAQFSYLGSRFPTEIPFTEIDAKNHRDFRAFNIGVKYGKYEFVKSIIQENKNIKNARFNLLYKLKVVFSTNKLLFYCWYITSKFFKRFRLIV